MKPVSISPPEPAVVAPRRNLLLLALLLALFTLGLYFLPANAPLTLPKKLLLVAAAGVVVETFYALCYELTAGSATRQLLARLLWLGYVGGITVWVLTRLHPSLFTF